MTGDLKNIRDAATRSMKEWARPTPPDMLRFISLSAWALASLTLGCTGGNTNEPSDGSGGSGGASTGVGGNGADPCKLDVDTMTFAHDVAIPWSESPPRGLAPADVPQFVALGWDDNGFLEAFNWAANMLRVRDLKTTFFMTTTYISDGSTMANPGFLRGSWRAAYEASHEIGHHTHYHLNGYLFTAAEWATELDVGLSWMTAPYESSDPDVQLGLGVPRAEVYGFRAPFLNYNDALFDELKERGIWYDCSIEEGFQLDADASSFSWPYTLDEGSAGHDYAADKGFEFRDFLLNPHPGIIELPAYALVIPPDEVASDYDFEPGLLNRILDLVPEREPGSDRITGLDYNLWWDALLSKEEFIAVLKYNLDQRLSGNRAPFLFGVHTDFYRTDWGLEQGVENWERRREAIEEFLDYARSLPEVRVTTFKEVADYMRQPRPLNCY
jgi:peptidoglycan/xylan/chitin deacetylase (PgdA/CDA1 family)